MVPSHMRILFDYFIFLKHFRIYKTLSLPLNINDSLFAMEIWLRGIFSGYYLLYLLYVNIERRGEEREDAEVYCKAVFPSFAFIQLIGHSGF